MGGGMRMDDGDDEAQFHWHLELSNNYFHHYTTIISSQLYAKLQIMAARRISNNLLHPDVDMF